MAKSALERAWDEAEAECAKEGHSEPPPWPLLSGPFPSNEGPRTYQALINEHGPRRFWLADSPLGALTALSAGLRAARSTPKPAGK